MMSKNEDWFESWFNTSYYHILYKHRDFSEGQLFMQHLIDFLKLKDDAYALDLACGKGRHSIYLNQLGFRVLGADLSKNSIAFAKQFENDNLQFIEHDMRLKLPDTFDVIFNLFTSFGFFEDDKEDVRILKNMKEGLKKDGVAIIDFMNVNKVKATMVKEEQLEIEGITFNITKYLKNGFIVKEINFDADGKHHTYFEKVKNLDLAKIKSYVDQVGFKIKHIFGNYQLETFHEDHSDRLILILE